MFDDLLHCSICFESSKDQLFLTTCHHICCKSHFIGLYREILPSNQLLTSESSQCAYCRQQNIKTLALEKLDPALALFFRLLPDTFLKVNLIINTQYFALLEKYERIEAENHLLKARMEVLKAERTRSHALIRQLAPIHNDGLHPESEAVRVYREARKQKRVDLSPQKSPRKYGLPEAKSPFWSNQPNSLPPLHQTMRMLPKDISQSFKMSQGSRTNPLPSPSSLFSSSTPNGNSNFQGLPHEPQAR